MSTVFGMLRIKNEARWIERVLMSIIPLCERIYVLDDHSTDNTVEICERYAKSDVIVYRSQFDGLDETRDKQFLLDRIMEVVPRSPVDWLSGRGDSPYWVLAVDGDEQLIPGGQEKIRAFIEQPGVYAAKLAVRYLWNEHNQVRMDGVYANFARPSVFRLMNRLFRFQTTPWGGNFHCSSIPQELLHHAHPLIEGADLLHYGYMLKEDRLRKREWYCKMDPDNEAEDCYRHCVQGDVPEIPASAKLKWAGPLEIQTLAV